MKILFLLFLISCAVTSPPYQPEMQDFNYITPTPKYVAHWDFKESGAMWTSQLSDALDVYGRELLLYTPNDIKNFTDSKFDNPIKRKQFYIALVSCMAKYESGFKPDSFYTEKFSDNSGNKVVSRGLLQISGESARGYKCDVPKDNYKILHDTKINLECGVRILNKWIIKDGVISNYNNNIYYGGARYWAVLRNEVLKKIQTCTQSLLK